MKFNISIQVLYILTLLFLGSCTLIQKQTLKKSLSNSDFFNSHFTGFILFDPSTNETKFEYNSDKYFIPASNTKLLTYYSSLVSLEDSIPSIMYETINDTLFFSGMGDPTFLHPDFPNQPVFDFLSKCDKPIVYVDPVFEDETHAAGWTWEDYEYYYQPERSGFPIYGNTVIFRYNKRRNSFKVEPQFFKDFVDINGKTKSKHARHHNSNIFSFNPDPARSDYKNRVPFKTSNELVIALLEDTLNRNIHRMKSRKFIDDSIKYSQKSNVVYNYMMKRSDNFCAEQLQYSSALAQNLKKMNSAKFRRFIEDKYFDNVSGNPRWKDGSGLSRYNLMTPRFLVDIVSKISDEIGIENLKKTLPTGGVDGTISNWYKPLNGESPYVFAKTGTLSNNHNLTGIITTKSGKDYFFSFMNNNYPSSSQPVKMQMEKVLRLIYENY